MNKATLIVLGLLVLAVLLNTIIPNEAVDGHSYGSDCEEGAATVSIYTKYIK